MPDEPNGDVAQNTATHGRPPRGLLSTPSSQLFQGRFGRMFRGLPAARYGQTEQEGRKALTALGDAMTAAFDPPKDGADAEESGIPALYTYLGQFIDHDITFDPVSTLVRRSDPDGLTDFRTPALDLDNIYGRGPGDQPYMYDDGPMFLLGDQLHNGAPDLPRNNAHPRRALIGDPRNDENSIVSQFQGLLLRFHNRMVQRNRDLTFEEIQRLVRFHYHYLILHDFLPRIVTSEVIEALKTDGDYDPAKLKFFRWRHHPFMPVEFSVAAYRLGHSMIRPGYRLNDDTLLPIFPVRDFPEGLTGFREMNPSWGIDWGRLIDVDPRPDGTGAPDDPDTRRRLQFAYRIDTSLVNPLATLPSSVAPDTPRSLAERNLLRGLELSLPSGQAAARAMGVDPLPDEQIVIGKAVDEPGEGDVLGPIGEIPGFEVFRGNCPLWTYILAEAAQNRVDVALPISGKSSNKTPQLGPVGGRIVAEVFLGLMFGDSGSLLNLDPSWTPENPEFRLKDLVRFAVGE